MKLFNTKIIDRSTLLFHLTRLTRQWRKKLDMEIQAAGLTDATWRPLLHLQLLGDGTRQKDLAASVGIEGPSIVRLIETLIAKDLIVRTEDASDRRAKLLSLTEEGRQLVERIHETVTSLENELLTEFNDDDISRIAQFIQRLEHALGSMHQGPKA
jgi:MarR family transcriptional regulator for hemolysin